MNPEETKSRFRYWFLPIFLGGLFGICFGGITFFENPRPTICVFLQKPLISLFSYLDTQSPPPGLEGLIIIIPVWFIYWACLGTLIGFLLKIAFSLFLKLWRPGKKN
jgi:hypothetical protein